MPLGLVTRLAVVTGAGALVAWLAGAWAGAMMDDAITGVLVRVALVTVVLVAGTSRLVAGRVLSSHRGTLRLAAILGLLIGYGLVVPAWTGRAYVAQLAVPAGLTSTFLDLGLWLVIGALVAVLASRRAGEPPCSGPAPTAQLPALTRVVRRGLGGSAPAVYRPRSCVI